MSKTQQPDHSNDPEHVNTGTENRAHGAHGKGDTREALHQQGDTQPDGSHATPASTANLPTGSAGWGSEGSGGSTVERRSEPRGKDKKKKR
jgi:hypothetical protein